MRRKKHSNKGRRTEEKEEEHRTLPAPGSRSYGMARQCPRGHSSCKAREVAGVTPTNTTTAAQHGDDGTGAASSTRARSISEARTSSARTRSHRSSSRRFSSGSRSRRFARRGREGKNGADRSIDLLTAVQDRVVATAEKAGDGRSRTAAMAATPSPRESPDS